MTVQPPGAVRAAAILTWVGAAGTAVMAPLATLGALWLGALVLDSFELSANNSRWWLIGAAVAILDLSAAAAVLARRVWRGDRWGPLVLSLVAALAAVVLLLLPASRARTRASAVR